MNLSFNELSLKPYQEERILTENLIMLLDVFNHIKKEHMIKHIFFPQEYANLMVTLEKNFIQWIGDLPSTLKSLLLGLMKKPFIEDVLENDQQDDLLAFYFEDEATGFDQDYCNGLAMAYLKDIPAISLKQHPIWERDFLKIFKTNGEITELKVFNLSTLASLTTNSFKGYIESITEVKLVEAGVDPDDKPLIVRDDHGQDILRDFGKKLNRNPYVTGIINSLPFNPHTKRFVKTVKDKGIVELVLFWNDRGIGLAVQTTGRNHRETNAIASILEEEYSK